MEKLERNERNLLPPPRLMSHGELQPIIEPPLKDLAPFPGSEQVDEWEPFESGPAENQLTEEQTRRAQVVALNDERVERLLKGKRYISIGASLRDADGKSGTTSVNVVFYDYTNNLVIEVLLDREAQKVTQVAEMHYQPAPLQQEIEHAIGLARKDKRLAEHLSDDLEGTAILVSPVDPTDPNYFHRQFDVRFGCPDERLPRYMALVDLSTETVLKVGSVGSDCGHGLPHQGGEK